MKERIKHIMEQENLTPAKFADRLQINRAIISHILNGRNNPSLDVVTRILSEMNYINPEWLLNGTGNMYKKGVDENTIQKEPDLFHQNDVNTDAVRTPVEKPQETLLNPSEYTHQTADNKTIETIKTPSKEIAQIIVYFTDQTFKIFTP